jgi:membrane protein required for colicin V production
MLLDLLALAILGLFVLMGALRGGVASLMSLLTLVLSYTAAVWGAQLFGAPVGQVLGGRPLVGTAVAGTTAFLATAVCVGLTGLVIRKWSDGLRGDSPMGVANRWLGGFFGFVRGALVVLLVSWLVIWLDAARETGAFQGLEAVPDVRVSSAAKITEKVVEKAVSAALDGDGPTSDVVARLASRPGSAVKSLQSILSDRRIEELQGDRFFWTLIENGAYARAMNRHSFQAISRSEDLRRKFADVGVVSAEAAADRKVFEEAFAEVLAEVGPRVKGLANDPEMERLASDPEILALLESGDTLGLVRNEKIQRLVARVSKSQGS